MPNLTSQEKAAVEELRQRVINELNQKNINDENMFYRFLKARDFKVDLSEAMLRKDLAWRKANQVDTILTDFKPMEVMEKYFSDCFIGFDKDGSVVQYSSLGDTDDEGLFKSVKFTDFAKHLIYSIELSNERLKHQSEKLGREIYQFSAIYDFKHLTFSKAMNKRNLQNMMFLISLVQDHYPERLKRLFVINAPIYFTVVFSIVKAVMADAVLQKISIFGSEGWQEALLQAIDADVLPAFLGGQRTDPDGNPLCNTFIIHGSLIPKKYYLCNIKMPMWKRPDAKKLLIPALSKDQVEVNVEGPNIILEWEYETTQGDIGFGLLYNEHYNVSAKTQELIPIHRVQSCDGSETGMFRCEALGTYILVFDNSHSFFHQKELYYKIVERKLDLIS